LQQYFILLCSALTRESVIFVMQKTLSVYNDGYS